MPLGLPWSPCSGEPAGSGSQGINHTLALDYFFYFTFPWLEKAGVYHCTCKTQKGWNTVLVSLLSAQGTETIREGTHGMGKHLPTSRL